MFWKWCSEKQLIVLAQELDKDGEIVLWQLVVFHCQSIFYFQVNRGPNKRQIKPAENNSLLQLALGEDSEDSEEDKDFELNDDEEGLYQLY